MASITGKAKIAIQRPGLVIPFLRYQFLRARAPDPTAYPVPLDGYELLVDLTDKGIGKDLALEGAREPISSAAYRQQLHRLDAATDAPVTVAELGANIGFYALMPVAELDDARVFAAEVDADNAALLERNVAHNGMGESVTVDCVAIGDETGETTYYRSSRSNWNQMADLTGRPTHTVEATETPVVHAGEWLARHGLDERDVDAIRMDVQGYEATIMRALPDVFDHGPVVVHMEIHADRMRDADVRYLRARLADADLEIVTTARGETAVGVETVDGLFEYPWIEVVGYVE